MIAAINKKHRVVWGMGNTPAEARADAYKQLESKHPDLQAEGVEPLVYVPFKPDTDLSGDGQSLYLNVKLDFDPIQTEFEF